jgi:branched-chain amino acid transport system substrate-binding protein
MFDRNQREASLIKLDGQRRSTHAIIFSGLLVAICASTYGVRAQSSEEPFKIGGMFSTTGILGGAGAEALAGAQILIEEVNAAGGVNGRPVLLISVDDESRPEQGVSQLKRLIQRERVSAIAGPASTVVSASLSPILNESKIAAVGCICFLGPITPYEFSTFPLSGIMSNLGQFATGRNLKKIGVISQAGALAELVQRTQLPILEKLGFEIVGFEQFQASDTDVTPLLARLQSKGAELIFGAGSGAPAALIAKNFKQISYPGVFWTYGGNATASFINLVGDAGDIVNMGGYKILVYRELPDNDPIKARLTAFAEKYRKKTGKEPGLYAAYGYDTALSLVEAIRVAGPDREKIRDALETQTNLRTLNGLINRSAAQHNGMETDWVKVRLNVAEKRYQLVQ